MMTTDLIAIGVLASESKRSVRAIEHAAEVLGIRAALRLNHVPHFSAEQVEQLTRHFREESAR